MEVPPVQSFDQMSKAGTGLGKESVLYGIRDFPFVVMGAATLLLLWRADLLIAALLRPPRDGMAWKRCRAAAEQLLRTLVDLMMLAPLAILLGTLYRLPNVGLRLAGAAGRPITSGGAPRLQARAVRFEFPERGAPRVLVEATKPAGLTLRRGARIRALGTGFWSAVGDHLGQTVMGAARGFLPLNLAPGRGIDAESFVKGEGNVAFRINVGVNLKRRAVADHLSAMAQISSGGGAGIDPGGQEEESARVLLQMEGHDMRGKPCVLLALWLPLGVLAEAASSESQPFEVPRQYLELSEAQLEAVWEEAKDEPGIRDVFAVVVATEFVQFLLEVAHLVMFVFSAVSPIRLLMATGTIIEPKKRWQLRLCQRVLLSYRRTDWYIESFLQNLVPTMNDSLKEDVDQMATSMIAAACRSLKQEHLESFDSESKILQKLLKCADKACDENVGEFLPLLRRCIDMQDAALHYVVMRPMVHVALWAARLDRNEHAIVLQRLNTAQASFQEARQQQLSKAERQLDAAWERLREAEGGSGSGIRLREWGPHHKEVGTVRHIIRMYAAKTLLDLCGLLLLVMMMLTVVRVLPLMAELRESGVPCTFIGLVGTQSQRAAQRHLRKFGMDGWLLLQTLFFSAVVAATVVQLFDFLGEAMQARSLPELRNCALQHMKEAFSYFLWVLSLGTYFKLYKEAAHAAIYVALIPVLHLSDLVVTHQQGPAVGTVKANATFAFYSCFALWAGLVAGPFVVVYQVVPGVVNSATGVVTNPDRIQAGLLAVAGIFGVVVAVGFMRLWWNPLMRRGDPGKGWTPPTARITWPNLLALTTIVVETLQVSAAVVHTSVGHLKGPGTSSAAAAAEALLLMLGEGSYAPLFWIAVALVAVWSIVSTVPIVIKNERDKEELVAHPVYRNLGYALSQPLFLSIVLCLVKPFHCNYGSVGVSEPARVVSQLSETCWVGAQVGMSAVGLLLLTFFLLTSLLMSPACGLRCVQTDMLADVQYPALYTTGVYLLHALMVLVGLFGSPWPGEASKVLLGLAVLELLWTPAYPALHQARVCCIAYIAPLRFWSSVLIAFTAAVCAIADVSALHDSTL
ncbi:hypothetical protein CYMTET_17706, partial [Cymbomonas tetramitiformis]